MKEATKNKTRRTFLSETGMVAAGLTLGASSISAKSYSRITGANDKVRVGFIGVGNRGSQVMHEFMNEPDCEVAALCDVYEPYMFRWWEEYDNQILNNGVHALDLMRWLLNEKSPVSVTTLGGKYVIDDDRTIPDTMQTIFEFPSGVLVNFSILEASSGRFSPRGYLEFRGTHGTLYAGGSNDYKIVPATSGQFQDWGKMIDAEDYEVEKAGNGKLVDGTYANPGANLVRNFLDCVKSRQMPVVSMEEGHLSTSMAHLATISLQVNQTLKWDAEKEIVTNSEKANELLSYEYRKPWKL